MKLIKQILAALAVVTLGTFATFLIFCCPADDSPNWVGEFYGSKIIGIVLAIATYHLHRTLDWNDDEDTDEDYWETKD